MRNRRLILSSLLLVLIAFTITPIVQISTANNHTESVVYSCLAVGEGMVLWRGIPDGDGPEYSEVASGIVTCRGSALVKELEGYEGSPNMAALDLRETFMASIGWTTATYPRPSKLDIVEHEDGDDYWRLLVDGGRIVGVQFIGRSWRALDAVILSMLKHIDLEEARRSIERGLMMAEPWRVKLQSFLR